MRLLSTPAYQKQTTTLNPLTLLILLSLHALAHIPSSLNSLASPPPQISPPLSRRTPSITQNNCPPGTPAGYLFNWSYCFRTQSPRAYKISCSPYYRTRTGWRRYSANTAPPNAVVETCPENHFCVNGVQTPSGPPLIGFPAVPEPLLAPTAYCVSTENIFNIVRLTADVTTGGETQPKDVTAAYLNPGSGHVGAVEAILTDSGGVGGSCLNASMMAVRAQTNDLRGSMGSWRDLLGGVEECEGCASLGVVNVSAMAMRIEVGVELGVGVSGGLLFIAGVFS